MAGRHPVTEMRPHPMMDLETWKLALAQLANLPFEIPRLGAGLGAASGAVLMGTREPSVAYFDASDHYLRNFTPFGNYLQESPLAVQHPMMR